MCAKTLREKSPGRVAAGMETQRKLRRKKIQPRFKDLIVEGIASDGSKAMTRPLKKLGIYKPFGDRFGILRIHFRVDGRGPKRVNTMDPYRAVRQSKHIPEKYIDELKTNDTLLWKIGKENLVIAAESMDEKEMLNTVANLQKVHNSLKRLKVPKKKFSKAQLTTAIKLLNEALEENPINVQKTIWACTKLFSFRTRYGDWRDEEIINTSAYSELKGYALRKIRDELLLGYISDWIRYIEGENRNFEIKGLWSKDLKFSDRLERLVDNGKKVNPDTLGDMTREFYDAGYRLAKLNRAYEHTIWGNQRLAKRLIREYMLALRVRNPLYVAREMEKEEDGYYHKAKDYLTSAADLIRKNVFHRATVCFRDAAEEIKKRRLKPQTSLAFPSPSPK